MVLPEHLVGVPPAIAVSAKLPNRLSMKLSPVCRIALTGHSVNPAAVRTLVKDLWQ